MKDKLSRSTSLLLLLGLLHLPMLWVYYSRLWMQEHYQFFPFALGAFGWFLWTRFKGPFVLTPFTLGVAAVDVLLLLVGTLVLQSPWLVALGFVCWCFVIAAGLEDREFEMSLGYLVLLPLLTLRLPLGWDTAVIQWLQRVTTAVASLILNDFGYLHLREGNVIEFPGKRFLVADACSGVQSLFTLLFLGALISCGYRRKWGHSLFVLLCAAGFAGLMNVARVYVIAVAWDAYGLDLASGWPHDVVGYVALISAALLVLSADAFVFFVFSPVPDMAGQGMSALYRNPLVVFWNVCFLSRRRLTPEQMAELEITEATDVNKMGDRVMPERAEYFRPGSWFSWLFGFLENWLFSRNPAWIRMSVPFLMFGIGGAAFVWWLATSPQNDVVKRYEAAVIKAIDGEDADKRRVYLETLLQLRPKDQRYRLQHVANLVEEGQPERALPHIQMLTSRTGIEYSAAHLWLARQAVSGDSVFDMEIDEVERHLLRAVELNPTDTAARQLLAAVLRTRGQLRPAEKHLYDIVDTHPEVALDLAQIMIQLERPEKSIQEMAERAASYCLNEIKNNPRNAAARIQRSEAPVILGQIDEAEQNLVEGASDERTPEVVGALSRFYVDLAARRMQESTLNREFARGLVQRALQLSPANRRALALAVTLDGYGLKVPSDVLQPAIDDLQQADEPSMTDRLLLVQILALANRIDEALVQLEPMVAEESGLRLLQIRLLRRNQQQNEASRLIDQVVADSTSTALTAGESEAVDAEAVALRLDAAEALSFRGDLQDSRDLLTAVRELGASLSPDNLRRSNILWSRVHLALFDERQADSPGTGVTLLEEAFQAGGDVGSALERLVQVSFGDGPEQKYAEQLLTELLSKGRMNANVYTLIGSQAIVKDRIDDARKYLERAYSMNDGDPMILNNLALALVRGDASSSDPDRAMRMVDRALRILPDHPDVLSTRGEVYVARREWENARRDLEVALKNRPNSVRCRQLLGMVCEAQGDGDLAREHRRRASELLQQSQTPGS